MEKIFFKLVFTIMLLSLSWECNLSFAQNINTDVSFKQVDESFALVSDANKVTPIVIDNSDYQGVLVVGGWFVNDLKMVSGQVAKIYQSELPQAKQVVLVGTIGKNKWIDQLIKDGKIDVSDFKGQWERSLTQVVENPFPGIEQALVLAGSDKRGTIYAMLNLSRAIGVSPWYWWADVPVDKHEAVYVKAGRYVTESPKVKYRGIFLNDEEPALGGWVRATFGGFNSKFYSHVFELTLRLRGNFLWPAMWGKAFFDDDPENGALADKLGIVMSTSHHEPMGRAQEEWHRYGSGLWNYNKNKEVLSDFWKEGMERNKDWETIVTVGMRGDGDEAMEEGTNISLLEKIVKDQRKTISKVTGKKAEETPQVWALYKEVQDYYDKGMRVPDDVTLLFCDDNWGNVRKLPDVNAPVHEGGYGMYYHVDYVGGPRSYRWINVSQIQRIWEQMNLTYSHGVDRIWVLNVGDLKPMEFPITFFLDMAWDPTAFNSQNLYEYTVDWCAEQFGEKYAKDAARILNLYTKYNHRVTPELLDHRTFSLENYNEFERVRNDYRDLTLDALRIYNFIPNEYKDAFDQLILFPTNASCNLYEMYYAVAKNRQLAAENDPEANYWADVVKECFDRDSLLTVHYNEQIADGKWIHQMDQIRIGYKTWAEPRRNTMPDVIRVEEPVIPNSELAFCESDGYVSIEAVNYQIAKGTGEINWQVIPDLGKTESGVTTFPQNIYPAATDSVYLEYSVDFKSTGKFNIHVLMSPTLNFNSNKGLRYAVSFDGGEEQVVNFNGHYKGELGKWQAERIIKTTIQHRIDQIGMHRIRVRVLEPGIVFQKILIDTGGLKPSYLGAPQSKLSKI
ncbi:glycosyl hydrolase 115 family protein [Carboxylicivirga sp. N1Y90]|uniref:glycosyl hydrolase 115 family protein n=1 Tax=Carboxylicivirga fragile TaxID=3417571 RepID=UPI003D34D502|nr:glycosyl hydrolase 115 family protein [Marinilabiliaceae bacterium N1Y90]